MLESSFEVVNDYEVRVMRRSKSWASNEGVYFYIKFEKPIKEFGIAENDVLQKGLKSATGKNIKTYFSFDLGTDKTIQLKISISGVSEKNAKQDLDTEIPARNFEKVKPMLPAHGIKNWVR